MAALPCFRIGRRRLESPHSDETPLRATAFQSEFLERDLGLQPYAFHLAAFRERHGRPRELGEFFDPPVEAPLQRGHLTYRRQRWLGRRIGRRQRSTRLNSSHLGISY